MICVFQNTQPVEKYVGFYVGPLRSSKLQHQPMSR
jgi:hypothetical protein